MAASDRVALVQYEAGDGPCVTALGGEMIRIACVPADGRFPHFAQGAADQRVHSIMSIPAIDHGEVVGSLNVYLRQVDAFDDRDHDVALIMAARSQTPSSARSP